jgi:site-specific recombinase XerD
MTFPDAAEEYFAARRVKKDSPHTTAAYRRDLAAIAAIVADSSGTAVGDLPVDQFTARALRDAFGTFADAHARASIGRCWSTWNQFLNFLVGEGELAGNPMAAVSRPREVKRAPKPLVGEQTPETLLRSAAAARANARDPWPERDVAILATLLVTGIRSSELLSLQYGSLSGRAGEQRLHVIGKGDKPRSVPVEDSLVALIDAYLAARKARFPSWRRTPRSALFVDLRGEPLRRGGLRYLVEMAMRQAGVGDQRHRGALVHAMRHTFATRLAEDGAAATEIMKLLGHASLSTSQLYIDATAVERRLSASANRTYGVVRTLGSGPMSP